ncbi:MAG: nitrous oxide reductase accessory protein NosL [Proteobacteria bacterium]|nr:nitrous oxide reductase accessory protein NosL [Pseudomonadota bacterium]MBU1689031.1 nitrous oxide reductase accessory protein NosL [Pseudomonadota bacterium]
MKKILLVCALLCSIGGVAYAMAQVDITQHTSCAYCGMDRQKFAHSRMLITYDDNSSKGLCSLHCASIDLANQMDKMPQAIKVGDYNSKELIDAEEATWVLGGSAKGVMTGRAKWAFADRAAAEEFTGKQGGEIVDFETAIKASYEDMYQDTKMIRMKRREMKKMKLEQKGKAGMGM